MRYHCTQFHGYRVTHALFKWRSIGTKVKSSKPERSPTLQTPTRRQRSGALMWRSNTFICGNLKNQDQWWSNPFVIHDGICLYIWVFPKIGVPKNGWFMMENPIKMDDLEVLLFSETPICSSHIISYFSVHWGEAMIRWQPKSHSKKHPQKSPVTKRWRAAAGENHSWAWNEWRCGKPSGRSLS